MEVNPSGETRIEPEIVLRKVPGRGEGAGGVAKAGGAQQKPTLAEIRTSRDHVPRELTPSELFEKVAHDDVKQNRRLSAKFLNGSPPSPFKRVGESTPQPSGPEPDGRPTTRMRFIICTLGLMSLAMSQMSRMVLNQSITQMVDPSMLAQKQDSDVPSDGSCPWPEEDQEKYPAPRVDDVDESYMTTTTLFPVTPTTTRPLEPVAETTTTTTTQHQSATTLRPLPGEQGDAKTTATSSGSGLVRLTIDILPEGNTPTKGPLPENLNELPDFEEHPGTTSKIIAEAGATEQPTVEHHDGVTHVFEIVTEAGEGTGGGESNQEPAGTPEPTTPPPPTSTRPPGGLDDIANNDTRKDPEQQAGPLYPQYKWTMQQQNTLLGGFYYSYFVFMVLGGRMAEIYGAKYVLLLSVGGSALINLATPWMASSSFTLLVMSRVVMGAIQSGVFPGMYALIAKWLTMTEASIYAPLIKMNLRLGMVLGSLLPGLAEGWPNVFYLTGVLSAIWSLLWLAIASSDPADNRWVSPGELTHINRKKKKPAAEPPVDQVEMGALGGGKSAGATAVSDTQGRQPKKSPTPWAKILTAPSVIGLIIVKLTFNYALDFLAIELPSYLRYVHHASKETISAITGPMFGIQVVLIVFVGWLAKVAVQRRPMGLDKTGIRKLFQGLASFGMALTFFLLTFNDCNLTYVTVLLQIISLLSMFTAGGETMLPYDLSLEYPATIMAIANSVANLSGVTTTTLTGLVLGSQGGSYYRWNILIYLIAGANLLGGLAFTLLVQAEPIDFSAGETDAADGRADIEAAKTAPSEKRK